MVSPDAPLRGQVMRRLKRIGFRVYRGGGQTPGATPDRGWSGWWPPCLSTPALITTGPAGQDVMSLPAGLIVTARLLMTGDPPRVVRAAVVATARLSVDAWLPNAATTPIGPARSRSPPSSSGRWPHSPGD
jgi:hypothetical protein